ncbi:hypothetical protein [Desulfurispira natronophila]|uniref:Uncharacterized protein n=1 Tax=Desulfurispira natronophila TaxID=682562 RepID=A0A7W8DH91_9BACT|nr:hypothetical protein [Desulfurispira natronophila]MBB5022169.1 hypothetical protein [Desulfurispira natronophila]
MTVVATVPQGDLAVTARRLLACVGNRVEYQPPGGLSVTPVGECGASSHITRRHHGTLALSLWEVGMTISFAHFVLFFPPALQAAFFCHIAQT